MTDEITYTHRLSALTKLREYRLTNDALIYKDENSSPVTIPYGIFSKVTAEFAPSRVQPNRYFLHLYGSNNGKIDITNTHFAGIGDLEDRSKAYVPFAIALHNKILVNNPAINFEKATTWGGYFFSIIIVLFLLCIVAVAGFLFVVSGLFWVTLIKLALIVYYFPSLIRYVKRNKPGKYDPLNLNQEILPSV